MSSLHTLLFNLKVGEGSEVMDQQRKSLLRERFKKKKKKTCLMTLRWRGVVRAAPCRRTVCSRGRIRWPTGRLYSSTVYEAVHFPSESSSTTRCLFARKQFRYVIHLYIKYFFFSSFYEVMSRMLFLSALALHFETC